MNKVPKADAKKKERVLMEKVPIVADIENLLDKTMKDLMGPFEDFYPLLKLAVIFSSPTSLLAYTAYRSIPHLVNGLTSKKAVEAYKTHGKKIGKKSLKFGLKSAKFLGKVSQKALVNTAKLGKKQFTNTVNYFFNKENSTSKLKENIKNINLDERNISDLDSEVTLNPRNNPLNKSAERQNDRSMDQGSPPEVTREQEQPIQQESSNENSVNPPEVLNSLTMSGGDSVVFTRENGVIMRQYRLAGHLGGKVEMSEEAYNSFIASHEINNENSKEREREFDNNFEL